jgi:hypothetical protein
MIRHQMAAALRAEAPVAELGLLEMAEEACSLVIFTFPCFHSVNAVTGAV